MQSYIPKPKLLLVDDDKASRIMVTEILESTNIIIIEAFDCNQAVSLFRKHSKEIGLVIIDIVLPDGDGVFLLKEIHAINPFVPAIALSAIEPALLVQRCKNTSFNAYVTKPFDLDVFMGIIVSYMALFMPIIKEY
jgi:CheY-like chemotaxis protein